MRFITVRLPSEMPWLKSSQVHAGPALIAFHYRKAAKCARGVRRRNSAGLESTAQLIDCFTPGETLLWFDENRCRSPGRTLPAVSILTRGRNSCAKGWQGVPARSPRLRPSPPPPPAAPARDRPRGPPAPAAFRERRPLPVRSPDHHTTAGPPAADGSLLRVLRAGDPRAAEELYARYAGRIRSLVASRLRGPLAPRLSPEDIVQSVFRTFFEGVVERAYAAPEGEELWGLLARPGPEQGPRARRLPPGRLPRRPAHRRAGWTPSADRTPRPGWLGVEVDDLLARFRPADREVIHLRMLGYEVTEIADRTGRSLRTVERVLQKARTRG